MLELVPVLVVEGSPGPEDPEVASLVGVSVVGVSLVAVAVVGGSLVALLVDATDVVPVSLIPLLASPALEQATTARDATQA